MVAPGEWDGLLGLGKALGSGVRRLLGALIGQPPMPDLFSHL